MLFITSEKGKIDLLRRLVDELGEEKKTAKKMAAADNIAKENLGKDEVTTVSGRMSPD
ncbi:hypothetical protein OROHE_010280 [Orobanche hederae]